MKPAEMPHARKPEGPATVAQLAGFEEVIDVRSPAEFAEDHVPGAINCPVLDDAERARVGTLYKQVSPFEAKKVGAALVARNIARHIEERFLGRPKTWRPLVYCWRGGKRSGALAHVLREIGWEARTLDGGYKAYRRAVTADLADWPGRFRWIVVCGMTGSGKSRLLRAIAAEGGQVLDLEELAAHRGSVLGGLPDRPQPAQKMFESRVWSELRDTDPARPVFVEAESKKVGELRVPESIIAAMWGSRCVRVEADMAIRVALLKEEYAHFLADAALLGAKLDCLVNLHGRESVERWKALAQAGAWDDLVRDLLERHYDPSYGRSILRHYPDYPDAPVLRLPEPSDAAVAALAREALAAGR